MGDSLTSIKVTLALANVRRKLGSYAASQFALNMLQLSLGFSESLDTVTYYAHKDIEID